MPKTVNSHLIQGICLGSGIGSLEEQYDTSIALEKGVCLPSPPSSLTLTNHQGRKKVSPLFVPKLLINLAAGHISMKYGFKVLIPKLPTPFPTISLTILAQIGSQPRRNNSLHNRRPRHRRRLSLHLLRRRLCNASRRLRILHPSPRLHRLRALALPDHFFQPLTITSFPPVRCRTLRLRNR